MQIFIIQLLLLSCICENIEDSILELDSIVHEAIVDPKPHLWENLRENIGDLYMTLDDVYDKIKNSDEEGSRIVHTIEAKGGLLLSTIQQNDTVLAGAYNITEEKVDEIQQAIRGTRHIWDRITSSLNSSTTVKN